MKELSAQAAFLAGCALLYVLVKLHVPVRLLERLADFGDSTAVKLFGKDHWE